MDQVEELRHVVTDQRATNEMSRHLQSAMDKVFIEMKSLETRIQDEVRVLSAAVNTRVVEFDKSYQLIDGQLNEFNRQLKNQVDQVAEHNVMRVAEYTNLDLEKIFKDSVLLRQFDSGRDECEEWRDFVIPPETKEKLKLAAFVDQHKELASRLHFELAKIHGTLVQPTYGERFRAMLDLMESNKRICAIQHRQSAAAGGIFLVKMEMLEVYEDEWHLSVLKKPTMFTEYKNTRYNDILVNTYTRTITILFPEDGLFERDAPCVKVCSPRKMYQMALPNTSNKEDFVFRINFTTLKTSLFVENGFLLLRIHEVPKVLVDSTYFLRTTSLSNAASASKTSIFGKKNP